MGAILPEGAPTSLSLVVPLPRPAGDKLYAAGYLASRSVAHQEMNVVAGHDVVQNAESVAFARLVYPPYPRLPISGELQKELLAMAALRDVPNVAGKVVTIGARHELSPLNAPFQARKGPSKPSKGTDSERISSVPGQLQRSDPDRRVAAVRPRSEFRSDDQTITWYWSRVSQNVTTRTRSPHLMT